MTTLSCGRKCGRHAFLYREGLVSRPLRQSFIRSTNIPNTLRKNCRNPLEIHSSYSKSNTKASKGYKSPDDAFFAVSCGRNVVKKIPKDTSGPGYKIIHVALNERLNHA